ncbi:RDD family protein [Haliangium ochraceum]|uniref:RDD domain containing protein n=1 Tax=Haliangium ochraceum (strain DSM 14365 / JCM 11303 / SMP-2) TaxID=502025 RepID=D0LSD2_HALO1|nr:RDD family protein [Haliangium ochraceum]ACY15631.1 RDD domain containing protein [Haliangium ochraceum DSM 14365]
MNPPPRPHALADEGAPALRRQVVTPEGVPIGFSLARAGDRAAAFAIDMVCVVAMLGALGLLVLFAGIGARVLMSLLLVAAFLLQNFYFALFELRWQGQTPGKRLIGLRVIDAHGGALSAEAILARNLVRDVEFFLPAQVLFASEQMFPSVPGWARLAASLWALVLLLLPLFNRDRLRVGDMVAGTLVVLTPKAVLLSDVGGERVGPADAGAPHSPFSEQQLGIYGIYELQVLEDLLRQHSDQGERDDRLAQVCATIQQRIGWQSDETEAVPPEDFLRWFYVALRAHLERKMLFGKRRADKYAGE